jgi:hypothetical protein
MVRRLWKTAIEGIDTGSVLVETWIPDGGFQIQRRKTADGTVADCLAPKWGQDEVFTSRPCQEQPCLHRILAECPADRVLDFAARYGLLTFSMPRHLVGKKVRAADVLVPEPLALWHHEIRLLRTAAELWDGIIAASGEDHTRLDVAVLRRLLRQPDDAKRVDLLQQGRALLSRKVTEKMAGVRFDLTASPEGEDDEFVIRYRPLRLIDAIWQRLAEEIAGVITCARCPAPKCGRWFSRNTVRSDREYCSHSCQMRAWRKGG